MTVQLALRSSGTAIVADLSELVIAGWAGRDAAAVQHHVEELRQLGVRPPRATPLFYRVSARLMTTDETVEVVGTGSTGEAEAVLFSLPSGVWVGVGSDHTDRHAEAAGVTWSKQMCAKPVCHELWRLEDVAPHWDRLRLSSRAFREGDWRPYQDGTLAGLRTPADLVSRYAGRDALPHGTAMFLGTMPVLGTIAWADAFEVALEDPVLRRRLVHRYAIKELPLDD